MPRHRGVPASRPQRRTIQVTPLRQQRYESVQAFVDYLHDINYDSTYNMLIAMTSVHFFLTTISVPKEIHWMNFGMFLGLFVSQPEINIGSFRAKRSVLYFGHFNIAYVFLYNAYHLSLYSNPKDQTGSICAQFYACFAALVLHLAMKRVNEDQQKKRQERKERKNQAAGRQQ